MADCPECGKALDTAKKEQGEILECPDCGTELELASINPPQLKPAPKEQEDWGE